MVIASYGWSIPTISPKTHPVGDCKSFPKHKQISSSKAQKPTIRLFIPLSYIACPISFPSIQTERQSSINSID